MTPDAAPPLPPTGRIDLHCHLLPGVDDGCVTVAESLECIRRLIAHGYVGAVCTPHVKRENFPENTPANIAAWVNDLQDEVDRAGLEFRLFPGGEVRLAASTIAWFEAAGVPTLGDSQQVLVDYWGRYWPPFAWEILDWLADHGFQVLLAHPERMELYFDDLGRVISEVEARGVRLQGNLNSLSGGEGSAAHEWSRTLLAGQRYHVLASDLHSPGGVDSRVRGLESVAEQLGDAAVIELLDRRPREILGLA